jgi:hypothetical protein
MYQNRSDFWWKPLVGTVSQRQVSLNVPSFPTRQTGAISIESRASMALGCCDLWGTSGRLGRRNRIAVQVNENISADPIF